MPYSKIAEAAHLVTRPIRAAFLEPETRTLLRNWDEITTVLVAWLRFVVGTENTADPELVTLSGELSMASQRFRTLWARREAKQKTKNHQMMPTSQTR